MAKSRKSIRAQQNKNAPKTPPHSADATKAANRESKWQEFLSRHNVLKTKPEGS